MRMFIMCARCGKALAWPDGVCRQCRRVVTRPRPARRVETTRRG